MSASRSGSSSLGSQLASPPAAPRDATVEVIPVSSRRERRAFIELPFRLYRDDPLWVPPLRRDVAERIDPARHPFYDHAAIALFLARERRRGRIVGRIAAIDNARHLAYHADGVGFFGFFECERDPGAAAVLFDAAATWLRARGLRVIRGPASPSLNDECGLLVHGFDRAPVVMMPYNPPWYAELLEGCGFQKAKDLVAYWMGSDTVPQRLADASLRFAERHRLVVRPLDKRRFPEEIERIRAVYNSAWERNWGFVPMTEREFTHLAKRMKPVVDPTLVPFVEVDGATAGFALALPDLNRALRAMGGRLWPLGWLKGLWAWRRIDTLRVLTLGVLPPHRRTGASELLYLYFLRVGRTRGITKGEFSWILEDNHAMQAALRKLGAHHYKTYRLFDRPLDG